MDSIGVGLIGTGYMGKCHALAWTNVRAVFGDTPVVRRAVLCEVDEGLARRRADEFGFAAVYGRLARACLRSDGRRGVDHDAERPACADGDRGA